MGSQHVQAPQPSQEERNLQAEQTKLLRQQAADTAAFKPFIAQSMGFNYDPEKNLYSKMTDAERYASMSPLEQANYDMAKAYNQRQKDALEGKLPVDPALENDLALQKQQMEEGLAQKLGANWVASTPGIQAMDAFNRQAGALRESARRGQISTGEGLMASRLGLLTGQQQQDISNLQGWGLPQFSALQGAYSNAMQPYQFNRKMQFDANMQNAANSASTTAGLMGLVGTVGGMAIGGPFGGALGGSLFKGAAGAK